MIIIIDDNKACVGATDGGGVAGVYLRADAACCGRE